MKPITGEASMGNESDASENGMVVVTLARSWRPIETAPKHEDVLVYGEDVHRVGDADVVMAVWNCGMLDFQNCFWIGPIYVKPTHWMPLPDPPITGGAGLMACACGCGGSVTPGRRFVAGHNMRLPAVLERAGKRVWTADEDATLARLYPDMLTEEIAARLHRSLRAVYARARSHGLQKSEAFRVSGISGRLKPGDRRIGHWSQFKKGQAPPNKGLRRPGWGPGRMRETQFKKGEMRGQAQRNWKPIGTERISKDGYLERKVHDADYSDLPPDEANRKRQRRWVSVHRLMWEAANGPVPAGHKIAFTNGDKRDIRLDNLECVSDVEWMKRNTVHNLPKPLAHTIQLLGALKRQIRKRASNGAKQD